MPELPEVETVRRGLENNIIGCQIKKIIVKRAKTLEGISEEDFINKLEGDCFRAIKRKAKYLFLELQSGQVIVVHLKMSGAFLIHQPEIEFPKHTHFVFELANDLELRFKDLRAFGRMSLYKSFTEACQISSIAKLAPEPIEESFTLKHFMSSLQNYASPIKAILLDQTKAVSGVGNIYADESLFLSSIHPQTPANKLNQTQVKKLYESIKKVIMASIEAGGTTIRDYVNANGNIGEYALKLFVYGQKKKNCKVCGKKVEYIRLAQRGTHFCPQCQK